MKTDLVVFQEDLWTSILQPYKFAPISALSLAQVLFSLREDIKRGNSELVIAILNNGIEALFPFSEEHKSAHETFWATVKGDV